MKYPYRILLAAAFVIIGHTVYQAQQTYTIQGRVTSVNDKIEGVSAMLLSMKDSTMYRGDFFLSEEFSLQTDSLPALLRISSFGFRDTTLTVHPDEEFLNISLLPQPVLVDEVTVTARRPVFTTRPGHYTMNVTNDILTQSGTAVDLLNKMARIRINEKQGISVLGVGNTVVWIDGRQLPDDRSLGSITSSEIRKIEVITNPSAKYDAEGKAVSR